MGGKAIGYVRVSSTDQTTARQLEGVKLDRVFEDKVSGANQNRAQLQACLSYLRDGDTLHVHSIDRLARNLADLQTLVSSLTAKGVEVRFHKEALTFSANTNDPMQTLLFHVMGAFAQFERSLIRERQREGIAAAKAAGKPLGRRAAMTQAQIAEARTRRAAGESATALAKAYGVARATMYQNLAGEAR
jgi:DNA invertase Pin-like site-specific DNA recombinase